MVKWRWKSICGFGTSTGTFNLWVNFSPSPSPELLLHFEARDARKEIFSVLPPGRQLAQKQPFALTKSIAERVIRSKESANPSPMLVPISQQFNNPLPCLLLGPQASWSWSCHLGSVHTGYSRCWEYCRNPPSPFSGSLQVMCLEFSLNIFFLRMVFG